MFKIKNRLLFKTFLICLKLCFKVYNHKPIKKTFLIYEGFLMLFLVKTLLSYSKEIPLVSGIK